MIRNSVGSKLWLTIVGLAVVVLSLLSIFLEQLFDSYFYKWQTDSLIKRAAYIDQLTIRESQSIAFKIADELATESGSQIYIIGANSNDPNVPALLQTLSPFQRASLTKGQPYIHRGPESGIGHLRAETENLWVLYPMIRTQQLQGVILVHQPVAITQEAIQRIRELVFFSMGIAVVMTTGLGFVISKNLSHPVIQMTKIAERMAEGDFQGKVTVVTGDEVGRLGLTLNKLAGRLEETIGYLLKEKEQLSGILTGMTDGVVSADLDGRITLANPQAERWLRGFRIQRNDHTDVLLPSELMELKETVKQKGSLVTVEETWQGRSIVISMKPLYEPGEETMRGFVAVLRDVTEERRLDSLRKDFVANVSHELRTPLAMLQGYGEALLDDFGDNVEQRKELVQIILDETNRMKRLVNGLLDLAQLESGQFEMSHTQVDMNELLEWMGKKFITLANDKNIALHQDIPDQTYYVHGDTDRLEQVFTNLIDNAIRHTPADGMVSLALTEENSFLQITVSDTGEGIPAEDLPFIFERFYKADKSRNRSKSGTGIGLSIVKNIIQNHNGDIHVSSIRGKGTIFTVLLPKLSGEEREG